MKKSQDEAIKSMQQDENYVVLSNPLASPKFIRMIGKGKELSINDTYTPKIFIEIASKLTPEHLEGLNRSQTIKLEIKIKDFLQDIGANVKNYKHLIDSIEIMQSNLLRWKEGDEVITTAIISKSVHNEKTGKVEIYVDSDIARHILEVKKQNNFHFLKSNIFRLQNAQAIRLYPFFKSWENYPKGYETNLDRFKEQFGYNTSGYTRFALFEGKVLKPATEEINGKTDIIVTYEPTGENLDGLRPRVTGLIFWVVSKEKVVKVIGQKIANQERTTENIQKKEQTPPNKSEPSTDNLDLYDLFKKIPTKQKPDDITASVLVDSWVSSLGYETIKDGFLGMIATKAQPETVAFFTPDNFKKYIGYSKKQEEQDNKKKAQQEQQRKEQDKKRFFGELEHKYNEERRKHYQKKFETLTDEEKQNHLQELWEVASPKSVYFRNNDKNNPNSYAIEKIGEMVTFPNGYDHETTIKNYALKTFGVQIDFDQNGQMILASLVNAPIEGEPVEIGVFDRKRAAAQTPKVAEKIEEPQTPPPPQEQEPEIVLNKSVHEDEQTETPKGIGALLSKFKWK